MPARTAKKTPFSISGKVTLDGSNYQGAIVWLKDITTGGSGPLPVKDVGYAITNQYGDYLLGLTEVQSNYNDSDSITVSCMTQNGISKISVVVADIVLGKATANFTLTKKSGLVDGCKSSPLTDRSGGIVKNQLQKGCVDGAA